MQWIRDYQPNSKHIQLFRRALIITLIGNILLTLGKGLVAYFSGSVALYADTANSASDVVYSLMMAFGLWMAQVSCHRRT